jgi:hypothetical protein
VGVGSPDKGFEERFSSSGQRKRRSYGSERAWVACLRQSGIRERKISLLSVAEKKRSFHHAAEERKTITRSKG